MDVTDDRLSANVINLPDLEKGDNEVENDSGTEMQSPAPVTPEVAREIGKALGSIRPGFRPKTAPSERNRARRNLIKNYDLDVENVIHDPSAHLVEISNEIEIAAVDIDGEELIEAFKDLTQDGSIDDTIDHETYTPRPRSNSAAGLLETFERRGSFSTERRGSFSTERLGSVDGERRRSIHEARYKALAARGRSQSTGGDLNKDDDSDNFEDTTIVTMPMRRRSSSVSSLSRSTSSRIKNGLDTTQQRRLVELSKPRSYAESYVLPSFKMDRTNAAAWSRPASASTPQIDGTLRQKSVGFSCARKARTDRLARSAPWRMAKKDDDDKNVSDVSGVKISALRSARISGRISDLATPRTRRPSCEAELEAAVQHVPKVNHKGEVLGETSTVSGVRKGALTSRISSRVAEMAMPVHRQCEDDVDFVDTRSAFRVKTGSQGRHSSVSTSGPSPPPKPQNQNLRRRRSSVAW